LCADFTAAPGDIVSFQNIPGGTCTIVQVTGQTWPFNPAPPINIPMPGTQKITIRSGLTPGPYHYNPECCLTGITHTVTVT
jgi:hypothetical protein